MKVAVFGTKPYDRRFLEAANAAASDPPPHTFTFLDPRLDTVTVPLAAGHDAVCVFVNDCLDAPVMETLAGAGIRFVALRCAGFNNVDLAAAARLGITVARVPAYSPHAVAEHTIGLMLAVNRRIHRAFNRVREGNFELDGLLGFDMYGRTVGVVGTGQIGAVVCRILLGFGCRVLACDVSSRVELADAGVAYVPLEELLSRSDIVTLHCPLTPETRHLINAEALGLMKPGAMLVNTSRGALLDTRAVIDALKSGHLGHLALDVYEEEAELFFQDRSADILRDDVFARLLTFPNVVITAHQAFFTQDALERIAETTIANLTGFETKGVPDTNLVPLPRVG